MLEALLLSAVLTIHVCPPAVAGLTQPCFPFYSQSYPDYDLCALAVKKGDMDGTWLAQAKLLNVPEKYVIKIDCTPLLEITVQ